MRAGRKIIMALALLAAVGLVTVARSPGERLEMYTSPKLRVGGHLCQYRILIPRGWQAAPAGVVNWSDFKPERRAPHRRGFVVQRCKELRIAGAPPARQGFFRLARRLQPGATSTKYRTFVTITFLRFSK